MSIDGEKLLLTVITEFKDDFKAFKSDMYARVSQIEKDLIEIKSRKGERLAKIKGVYALKAALYGGIAGGIGAVVIFVMKTFST